MTGEEIAWFLRLRFTEEAAARIDHYPATLIKSDLYSWKLPWKFTKINGQFNYYGKGFRAKIILRGWTTENERNLRCSIESFVHEYLHAYHDLIFTDAEQIHWTNTWENREEISSEFKRYLSSFGLNENMPAYEAWAYVGAYIANNQFCNVEPKLKGAYRGILRYELVDMPRPTNLTPTDQPASEVK